jgi:hypothetical protein
LDRRFTKQDGVRSHDFGHAGGAAVASIFGAARVNDALSPETFGATWITTWLTVVAERFPATNNAGRAHPCLLNSRR